ncbi:MAG: T9SS type A sorting domain-containing protein [Bacteroidota bacterium]
MKKHLLLLSFIMLLNITLSAQDTLVTYKFKVNKDSSQTWGNAYNTDNIVLRDPTYHILFAYTTGIDGLGDYCLSSTLWTLGFDSTKYYYTSFATTAYTNILLSSKQKSSTTGPRDFKLQYKIGASGTWTDVAGTNVVCANDNFVSGVLTNIALPSDCDNQASVFVRWVMTSNNSVGLGVIGNAGTSRIDNIFVLGTAMGVGINTNEFNENVSIYPNPSNGEFTITNASETRVSIQIMDLVGKIVYKTQSTEKYISLNLENQNKGVYFVQITNQAGNKIVKKLVIK